ncbi:hypothetical protein V3596_20990 [Roseateles sp. MS17]
MLSTILGVFAGAIAISLFELAGHTLGGSAEAPKPAEASGSIILVVVIGWLAGAAVSAWVAGRWNGSGRATPGVVAALFLWGATGLTLWTVPHPMWAVVASMVLMPIVGWFAANRAVKAKS